MTVRGGASRTILLRGQRDSLSHFRVRSNESCLHIAHVVEAEQRLPHFMGYCNLRALSPETLHELLGIDAFVMR